MAVTPLDVRLAGGRIVLDAPVRRPPMGGHRVWLLPLTSQADVLAALRRLLSDDERARADAFRVTGARDQFIQVRGTLRLLLAGCLEASPDELVLAAGEFGKPVLEGGGLHFNVAHSGGYALLGIANGPELGVDLERVRLLDDMEPVAARILAPAEAAWWRSLPVRERVPAFFTLWTAKEALAKAMGRGLGLDFRELCVVGPAACRQSGGIAAGLRGAVSGGGGRYRLAALPAPAGYAAALAIGENPAGPDA